MHPFIKDAESRKHDHRVVRYMSTKILETLPSPSDTIFMPTPTSTSKHLTSVPQAQLHTSPSPPPPPTPAGEKQE